jgi:hypothetical protein
MAKDEGLRYRQGLGGLFLFSRVYVRNTPYSVVSGYVLVDAQPRKMELELKNGLLYVSR